jgi:hypothetical protein
MPPTPPPSPPIDPDLLRRNPGLIFQRTFTLLFQKAREIIRALTPSEHPQPDVPPRTPKERRQLTRARYTEDWICGLVRALAGDHLYMLPARAQAKAAADPAQSPKAAPDGTKPNPPAKPRTHTDHTRWLARLNRQRHVFATEPTATIAARLARRCEIKPDSDFWPVLLMEVHEPPAVWGARARESAALVITINHDPTPNIVPRDPADPALHLPTLPDRTRLADPPPYHMRA